MLGDAAGAVDAAERVGRSLDEPDTAVGMGDGGARLAVVARYRKFRDLAIHGHAADAIAGGLAEPQRTIAHRDRQRLCARRDTVGEFADAPIGRDAADAAHLA